MNSKSGKASAVAVLAMAALALPLSALAQVAVVLNSRDATVSLIDQATFKEVARLDVGKEPHHLYPTPDNKTLIVANAVSDDLHFLDPRTGEIRGRLRNIIDPYHLAFCPTAAGS